MSKVEFSSVQMQRSDSLHHVSISSLLGVYSWSRHCVTLHKFILVEMLFHGRMAALVSSAHFPAHRHCLPMPFSTIAQNFWAPTWNESDFQFPLHFQSKEEKLARTHTHTHTQVKFSTTPCIITQQFPVTKGLFISFVGAEYVALIEYMLSMHKPWLNQNKTYK